MFSFRGTATVLMTVALLTVVSGAAADQVKFDAARSVMQRSCFSCHAAWAQNNEQGWVASGIVIPKNVAESPLILRVKYGKTDNVLGAEDMPRPKGSGPWEAFSMSDYNALRDWILTLEEPTTGGGGGETNPETGVIQRASDEKLRIGDRIFVKSVLESIYGSEVSDITNRLIFTRISIFGGACDSKEHFAYLSGTQLRSDYMSCQGVDLADDRAALVPSSSTLREGLVIKACTEINQRDARVSAVAQALGSSTASWPTLQNITAAYGLFYPGRTLPGKVETSLTALVAGAKSEFPSRPLEGWRYLLLTLCKSPDWQQP